MWQFQLRSEIVLLGILDDCIGDQPWFTCKFAATPDFESIRPLFDEVNRVKRELMQHGKEHGKVPGDWQDTFDTAYSPIRNLGLYVVEAESARRMNIVLLYIDGQEARLRPSFADIS